MSTIAPITPSLPPPQAQAGLTPRESREQQLRIDQVVRATVSEGGMERIRLNVGPHRYLAETEVPLKTGASLTLQVVRTNPHLEFRLLDDILGRYILQGLPLLEGAWGLAEPADGLPGPAGVMDPVRLAWEGLQGTGEKVLPGGAAGLLRFLAGLGLDFEARLASGQAGEMAATLKQVLAGAGKADSDKAGVDEEKVEHFRGLVELWQLVRARMAREGVEFWPLPLAPAEQGFLLAERLAGEKADGERAGQRMWRLSLHLKLPRLGPLQIDFLLEGSGLLLRFRSATAAQAEMLAAHRDDLQRRVTALPLDGVSFGVGAAEPATVLVRKLAGDGMLDERI